jgi:tellurite methyltransferase
MADWEKRYRAGEHIADVPHPLVIKFAANRAPGRALDVACGAGRHALWLAEHGWEVTGVDASGAAIEILRQRAKDRGVPVHAIQADLERPGFVIEPGAWDLIVVVNYLQRDLFASIREGLRPGGAVIAVIAMVDDDPAIRPMTREYLMTRGELRAQFQGAKLIHDFEGKPSGGPARRASAEIVAVL